MANSQEHVAAMLRLERKAEELDKSWALQCHRTALEWVKRYNLPYKICKQYIGHPENHAGVVQINPCYPMPGYPVKDLLTFSLEDLDSENPEYYTTEEEGKHAGERIYNWRYFDEMPLPRALADRVEEHNRQFMTWDLQTDAGRKEWERQFAHFLEGYDIDSFSAWDMFGDPHAAENALEEKKRYYRGILLRFRTSKEAYRATDPVYLEEYADEYTDRAYLISLPRSFSED